ncbi:hypothetical protein [Nevskia sp.]|uniref:hypothetical protein n=1 Tax=Nevskia sp. TaxID=1929292 RepID=UPI003F6F2499
MKLVIKAMFAMSLFAGVAVAQEPTTEAEFAAQKALLKAKQDYYEQLALTAKAQALANETAATAETAVLTAQSNLLTAQYGKDLALAASVKGSGLAAATGKEGALTITAADKSLLGLQQGTLKLVDGLSAGLCEELSKRNVKSSFFAPADYDARVQKSIPDVVQFAALHSAAESYQTDPVALQFAPAAIAGVLVVGQYLAGGVQSVSKLFRSDLSVGYTAANRQALFEQAVWASCGDIVLSNPEARLRMNATEILKAWVPKMAAFVEHFEAANEKLTSDKAAQNAKRAAVAAGEKGEVRDRELALIDKRIADISANELKLAKYKQTASATKTTLSAIATGSLLDSLTWGQQYLQESGVQAANNLGLEKANRINYSLAMQDASVTVKSTFSADKLRAFSTGELVTHVVDPNGKTVWVGVQSVTTSPVALNIKELQIGTYSKNYGAVAAPPATR